MILFTNKFNNNFHSNFYNYCFHSNDYQAFDYCARIAIEVDLVTNPEGDARIPDSVINTCKNVFIIAILENHAGKQVELILSAQST